MCVKDRTALLNASAGLLIASIRLGDRFRGCERNGGCTDGKKKADTKHSVLPYPVVGADSQSGDDLVCTYRQATLNQGNAFQNRAEGTFAKHGAMISAARLTVRIIIRNGCTLAAGHALIGATGPGSDAQSGGLRP